ncbi:MAG: hypothetical protein WCJ94_01990 [bacterium]
MNKNSLFTKIILISLLVFTIPTLLFYYYDNKRVNQLNLMQMKIVTTENQKETEVVKAQLTGKIDEAYKILSVFDKGLIEKKYSVITENVLLKSGNYSDKAFLRKIEVQFTKITKNFNSGIALLMPNGTVISTTKSSIKKVDFKVKSGFIQSVSSKQTTIDEKFKGGFEYFIPINDLKGVPVAILYVNEPSDVAAALIRKNTQSATGTNFIINTNAVMLLNSDINRENTDSLLAAADGKDIINDAGAENQIRIVEYNNLKGLIAYRKVESLNLILCIFTPDADYKFMQKKINVFESALLGNEYGVPTYILLLIVIILGFIWALALSGEPFYPIKKIVKALSHIDEESFTEMLPKIKKGEYKKLLDSLIILRGRIHASEDKAEKLSLMSKELEEELSREASKADAEISQMRDALKIAERSKATINEELIKLKKEFEHKGESLPTVKDLLASADKITNDKKISIPGKNTVVDEKLLKNNEPVKKIINDKDKKS